MSNFGWAGQGGMIMLTTYITPTNQDRIEDVMEMVRSRYPSAQIVREGNVLRIFCVDSIARRVRDSADSILSAATWVEGPSERIRSGEVTAFLDEIDETTRSLGDEMTRRARELPRE